MTWRDHIHADAGIPGGMPAVRDTRPAVDFLPGLLDRGWSGEQQLEYCPQRTPEGLRAVLAFVPETLHDNAFYPADRDAA